VSTVTADLPLGQIAREPGAPPEDEWVAVARDVAAQLAPDAVAREQAAAPPVAEAALFREAGLLPLIASQDIGGQGRPYSVALAVVRQIAQVDSGLARLLAYHYAFSNRQASDLLCDERYHDFERRAVENRWLVASTGSPLGEELEMTASPVCGYRLNGTKYFATGARVADRIIGFVTDPGSGERLLVEIDPDRREVEFLEDWDVVGERLSASNGLVISDYKLSDDEILGSLGRDDAPRDPRRTLGILSFQLVFVHLLLGIAEGALLTARGYTQTKTRPWIHASVDTATEDPHILATYGDLVSRVQGLAALAERAERAVAWALNRGERLTARERAEAATLGAAAKAIATQVALEVTSRVFETTGARSAKRDIGLDRFWRNARTETLHSPVAYKLEEVGRFFLNDTIATPSDYR
jgi:alkylation response protein AidB-like acyl-CoA dehydrogenase